MSTGIRAVFWLFALGLEAMGQTNETHRGVRVARKVASGHSPTIRDAAECSCAGGPLRPMAILTGRCRRCGYRLG